MKYLVSVLILLCAAMFNTVGAQIIEFGQLSYVGLGAPLPVASFGTSYVPILPPYVSHNSLKPWGYGTFTGTIIPSIGFGVDDSLGIGRICAGNKFPKHLGTDYSGAAGTPVYAIADGTIVRANGFTGAGDYYVVIQSGKNDPWTTLYGHLNRTSFLGTKLAIPIKKGNYIGTLFNYRSDGDSPHLHLGIHKGPYNSTASNAGEANKGFACATELGYQKNKYNFVSPEQFKYYTSYY